MIKYFSVNKYEVDNPSIFETDCLVGCAYENCENKFFRRFVYRCVFDINFIYVTKNKEIFLQVSLAYREFLTEYDGLNKKIEIIKNKGFVFGQILKLTMKIYSNL